MMLKKLSLAVALVLSGAVASTAVMAANADGDSRVHLPMSGSTITEDHADVWFIGAVDADGYTIDLVGLKDTKDCTDADNAADVEYEKKVYLSATDSSLDCGSETVETLGMVGDYDPTDAADKVLHICKWTTPILANAKYALAINSYKFGTVSGSEIRGNCALKAAPTADEHLEDNDHLALASTANYGDLSSNGANKSLNYQAFEINVPTTGGGTTITQAPSAPELLGPAFGTSLDAATDELTFRDASPAVGAANWYEVFVYDKDQVRVNDFDDNFTFDHWYKIIVDASELECTPNADETRTCTIKLKGAGLATIDAAGTSDMFTWWVRGFNDEFGSGPWSAKGTFIK